jgi:hypothetical protein
MAQVEARGPEEVEAAAASQRSARSMILARPIALPSRCEPRSLLPVIPVRRSYVVKIQHVTEMSDGQFERRTLKGPGVGAHRAEASAPEAFQGGDALQGAP